MKAKLYDKVFEHLWEATRITSIREGWGDRGRAYAVGSMTSDRPGPGTHVRATFNANPKIEVQVGHGGDVNLIVDWANFPITGYGYETPEDGQAGIGIYVQNLGAAQASAAIIHALTHAEEEN